MDNAEPLIQTASLIKDFSERVAQPVRALDGVSLRIDEGEFLALSGPSGSGKTTLLNLIGGLDRPSSGTVTLDGREISSLSQESLTGLRRRAIGFIFSDFNLIASLSAGENIEYPLWLLGVPRVERKARVLEICERFEIAPLIKRHPAQLSRGQQQRVAVARALVHRPRIVLGDELTANLDRKTGIALMDFLLEMNTVQQMTFVFTTHDPAMIAKARRVVSICDGRIVDDQFGTH